MNWETSRRNFLRAGAAVAAAVFLLVVALPVLLAAAGVAGAAVVTMYHFVNHSPPLLWPAPQALTAHCPP